MQRAGHLAGGAHAAHVHVAVHNVGGGLRRQLRVAVVARVRDEVPQLVDGDRRLHHAIHHDQPSLMSLACSRAPAKRCLACTRKGGKQPLCALREVLQPCSPCPPARERQELPGLQGRVQSQMYSSGPWGPDDPELQGRGARTSLARSMDWRKGHVGEENGNRWGMSRRSTWAAASASG